MPTCPVCDHAQASGDECELCGKRLVGAVSDVTIATTPGLEPTRFEPVEASPEPVEGLEATAFAPAGDAPGERMDAELEPRIEGLIVAVTPMPDIERHHSEPIPEEPDALPRAGPLLCRYCRTPAMPGDKFCGKCGMRLSRYEPVKMAATERGEMICNDCGSLGPGPRCRRCGARMSTAT